MKVNKITDIFYKQMLSKYGNVLSKTCIIDSILNNETFIESEIDIVNIYLDELKYNLKYKQELKKKV